jgi:hydroxymethylbilane synthase
VTAKVVSFGCLNTQLAKDQTKAALDKLQAANPRLTCRLQVTPSPVSESDRDDEPFLAASAAEVEYLEDQLLSGEFRLAVVRALDLVLPLREGLQFAAVLHRSPPFDAFLTRQNAIIDEMPDGAVIGVMNLRSRTQMSALWPHLDFQLLRGGMEAALEALLRRCDLDGLVAPAAVAEHLGLQSIVAEIFNPEMILPSGGQGTLVVLGRVDDAEAVELLAPIHSPETQCEMTAEHAFLQRFASDLELPVGVLARCEAGRIVISGAVGSSAAATAAMQVREGPMEEAESLGESLAESLLQNGAALIGLLEADFPEGVPGDDDEQDIEPDPDVEILRELAGHDDVADLDMTDLDTVDLDDDDF